MHKNKFLIILILAIACLPFISCSKDKNVIQENTVSNIDNRDTTISFTFDSASLITGSSFSVSAKALGYNIYERGICWSLEGIPTIDKNKIPATTVQGNGAFIANISGLHVLTSYRIRSYAMTKRGIFYGIDTTISTGGLTKDTYLKREIYVVGSTRASIDIYLASSRGFEILERGIVYSTNQNPTIEDYSVKDVVKDIGGFRVSLSSLTPRTLYYVRPYLKDQYGYSYGPLDSFKTIIPGNLTIVYNKSTSPSTEEQNFWNNIQKSVDSAKWYFNNYTSATKTYWINYSPGTPTADCNNEGWIRVGTNSSYWTIGTMMHEMNHGMGTGTTSWWSSIMINGVYQGVTAQKIIKLIQNDSTMILKGDSQHWWPGGINQNSEVTSSWDYVYNALIMEAMRKDGQTHSGPYTKP